jgi:DNA ligase OB-like domain
MYCPGIKFQELISIVRTSDFNHPLLSMLELYIFDIYLIDNPPFEYRRCILEKAMYTYRVDKFGYLSEGMVGGRHEAIADNRTRDEHSSKSMIYPIEAIPPGKTKLFLTILYHAYTYEDIQRAHDYFVSLGYEGSMIKKYSNGATKGTKSYIESQYLFGKGIHILKYKYFTTKEAKCVEVRNSKGREEGCALLILENESGKRFSVRMKGGFDRRREWLQNPNLVLNKPVTYKYQELTDDGIPRFPIGLEVRDYEPGFNPLT